MNDTDFDQRIICTKEENNVVNRRICDKLSLNFCVTLVTCVGGLDNPLVLTFGFAADVLNGPGPGEGRYGSVGFDTSR